MEKYFLLIFLFALFLSACSPKDTSSSPAIPTTKNTLTPTYTNEPTSLPSPTSTFTQSPKPTNTSTQIITANFTYPVDPTVVPMYNAFDLDKRDGFIESNAGENYNGITYQCNGNYFIKGTSDNHFAYDFGTGNCSKHLVGTPVYGMSVGYQGEVIFVGSASEKYTIKVDYGNLLCVDKISRHIIIQFAHSIPIVEIGDLVDSETQLAELETIDVEVEIMVFDEYTPIDPRLIGLDPFP